MEPGMIIDERFRIDQKIGSGGQGEVYQATDLTNKSSPVALKIYHRRSFPKEKFLSRVQQEVEALQKVLSPQVIQLISSNIESLKENPSSIPYIVTEFAKHGNLRQHDFYVGEIELSLRLFRSICQGVRDIHRAGILHRDLKPSNILMVSSEKDIKIGDFGICLIGLDEDKDRATKLREKVGPIYFAAPEQTTLPPTFTKKSDIYSLGRILHYLITGDYEFTPTEEYKPVTVYIGGTEPQKVDDLIQNMISFDPKYRPADLDAVIKTVDELLQTDTLEKEKLQLTQLQQRAIKYLRSDFTNEATIHEILDYLSAFYDVIHHAGPFDYFISGGSMKWSSFASQCEQQLNQLEDAGVVYFTKGRYKLIKE